MATKKKATKKAVPSVQISQLLPAKDDWAAVWFDIDRHGEVKASTVLTERLICWALTDQGVVGVAPAAPSDEALGTYLPELVDENFRGYCREEDVQKFVQEWDVAMDDDDDEEEEEEDDGEEEEESEEDDDG